MVPDEIILVDCTFNVHLIKLKEIVIKLTRYNLKAM